jgi:hypothetical protein
MRIKKRVLVNPSFLSLSDRGRIRTPNPQSRNLIFYPVELRGQWAFQMFNYLTVKKL